MWKEFRDFIMRGNVIDLAVGIIIGAAFTTIVNSLVADILMPPIGQVLGNVDFSNLFIVLGEGEYASLEAARAAGAATINYGLFITNVINFLIVAFVVFMVVRSFNQMLVQKIMRERAVAGGWRRLALTEAGIAAISVAGLVAFIVLLALFPTILGRNVAEASVLFLPLLLVPAFRNLVEYHAELLYARELTGARIVLLCAVAGLKALLMVWAMRGATPDGSWALSLNLVFGAAWLLSAVFTYRLLAGRR